MTQPKETTNQQATNGEAGGGLGSAALLAAVKSWRAAEVHHAAIALELRGGDEEIAKRRLDYCTRELRIAVDEYFRR